MFWDRDCFEAIGKYCGGLVKVSTKTLNLFDAFEAVICVNQNLCGFLLVVVKISHKALGPFTVRISDCNPSKYPHFRDSLVELGTSSNPLDRARFQTVMELERSFPKGFDIY